MSVSPVPLLKVYMDEKTSEAVSRVLESGFVATGQKTAEFEEKFGMLINNPYVVATNSGSSAIAMALHMAGTGPGDDVISSPLTCLAVNESLLQTGADIVWADIDPRTGNISPESIDRRITPRTKAIVYSHWVGRLADMDAIKRISQTHDLKTIEDAASALGGEYGGRPVGTHSDYVAFSFQAVKHITTGDGGMLAVQTGSERDRAMLLRNHGNDSKAKRTPLSLGFDVYEAGWKYQMNDIAASIGICQLEAFGEIKKIHRRNLEIYESRLNDLPGLSILEDYAGANSNPWLFTVLAEDRQGLIKKLQEQQIGCSVVHMRNDIFSVFKSFSRNDLPNLDYFCERMINIPIGWWMDREAVHRICDVIEAGW